MDQLGLPPAMGMGQNGMVQFGQRMNALVAFYSRAEHSPTKSEEAGRPVYDAVDFIKVMFAGERDTVERAVKEEDKYRWPQEWARYKANQEQVAEGTPIEHLFPQNPEIVATLRHLNFQTVELLAGATDAGLQGIGMGGRTWHEKAKKFLETANKAVGYHKLQNELQARDAQIENQKDVIARLEERLRKVEADIAAGDNPAGERRGPGRPRKVVEPG